MTKRVIISFEEETIDEIDRRASEIGMTRNAYVVQICRKHIGRPSVFKEVSDG